MSVPTPDRTPMARRRLDGRVTAADGRPVEDRQARFTDSDEGGWWFRVRRAPGPEGVELVTRIPGYTAGEVITRHVSQSAADAAAQETYTTYRADVESALSGSLRAIQEAS